ncbi:MAG: hypothetical protein EA383_04090 [Spirochaetaceae bacterium]|nr:MAG: hypothetical protein EA383_04090 [Spirochaetaceae bacterium]
MDLPGPNSRLAALYSFPKILYEGQRLKITVLPPGVDGHARVGVAGVVVRADVPPSYPVGSKLTAIVSGVDPAGRISLEIVSDPPSEAAVRPPAFQPTDELLVSALVRSGLAVSELNLQTLRSGSGTDKDRPFAARLLAIMLGKGIPHERTSEFRANLESDIDDRRREESGSHDAHGLTDLIHDRVTRYEEHPSDLHLFNHLKDKNGGSWVRIPLGSFDLETELNAELRLRFAETGSEPADAVLEVRSQQRTWTIHWPVSGDGKLRMYVDDPDSLDPADTTFRSLYSELEALGLSVSRGLGSRASTDGFSDEAATTILPHIDTTA